MRQRFEAMEKRGQMGQKLGKTAGSGTGSATGSKTSLTGSRGQINIVDGNAYAKPPSRSSSQGNLSSRIIC